MIKPPFTMSKFMSEEDMHKTAHQYYRQACEEHEAYIELINKVVALLADGYSKWLSMYNIVKSENDLGVIEMTPIELIEQAMQEIAEAKTKDGE